MRIRWREIPRLLASPVGRLRLRQGAFGYTSPALLPLAGLYRRTRIRRTCVVAVVGSYGKTTTTRAVAAVLGRPIERYEGWNGGSFLASAVLHTPPSTIRTVFEVGIGRPGEMRRYARVLRPDLVVATSIGMSHHESFRTLEITRDEKCEMVRALGANGTAILNTDDPNVRWMASQTATRVIGFGFSGSPDVRASDVVVDRSGTRFVLHVAGETHSVRLRLIGRHMVYPALAAIAVATARNLPLGSSVAALEELPATPRRMEPVRLLGGALLLDDSYKSDLETFDVALEALREIPALRKVVVLGDITEPPRPQRAHYARLGEQAARIAARVIFAGGSTGFGCVRAGARRIGGTSPVEHAHHGPEEIAERLSGTLEEGDVVLVKGRHVQHLERVALLLRGEVVRCDLRTCRADIPCTQCPMVGSRGRRRTRPSRS